MSNEMSEAKEVAVLDAVQAVAKVTSEGAKKAEARKPEPVVYGSMAIGDVHWQGDVGFQRIYDNTIVGSNIVEAKAQRQLAPGTSRGSRHIINEASMDGLVFFAFREATALDGPVVCVPPRQKLQVDHPDHGTVTLPEGTYRIRYQQQYDALGEIRRVAD